MKILGLLVSTIALSLSTVAVAQTETRLGSRIARPKPAEPDYFSKLPDAERARSMVDDFSRCTLQYDAEGVDEALALVPETSGSNNALGKLAKPRCLRNATLKMPPALLRGSLFRAKVLREFADEPIVFADESFDVASLVSDLNSDDSKRFVAMQGFASCVVRADPENVALFVVEEAGSKAEDEALQFVIPDLGPCLSEGLELGFSKSMLSAILAEALYHELKAGKSVEPHA